MQKRGIWRMRKNGYISRTVAGILLLVCLSIGLIQNTFAATTYTKDALFSKFPSYLYNAETERRLGEMVQSGVDILKAQSEADTTAALLCTLIDDGISLTLRDILSNEQLLDSQNQFRKELAQNALYRVVNEENTYITASNKTISDFGKIKDTFKLVNGSIGYLDVCSAIDFSKTNLTLAQAQVLGEKIFAKGDGTVISIAGDAVDAWKIMLSVMELYEIELSTIDTMIQYSDSSSDLGIGLRLLKEERLADPIGYITVTWLTDKALGELGGLIIKLGMSFFETAETISFIHTCLKLFIKHGFVGATMTELTKAYMAYSNVNSMSVVLADCRLAMMKRGYALENEQESYATLFTAYIGAIEEFLSRTLTLTTPEEYDLHGAAECNLETLEAGAYISYSIHLDLCTKQLNEDIASGALGEDGELPEVGEQINAESIDDRIAAVQERWKPNAGIAFSERYGYSLGSAAFARKVFNLLYGVDMPSSTQNQYRYQLYGTQNVEEVGLLRHTEISGSAVKSLLQNALPGDILIGYGGTNAHYMVVISANDIGLLVYDCNSPFNGTQADDLVQQYLFRYDHIYAAFSTSEKDGCYPGLALYRASNRSRVSTDGSEIRYDDSENFVIENGVLTAYNGWQKHVVIPDGVTTIGEKAFYNDPYRSNIYTVTMPDSVTAIESSAFYNLGNLVKVNFSSNLEKIGQQAFRSCVNLTSVNLRNCPVSIERYAFYNCSMLSALNLGNASKLGYCSFQNCFSLKCLQIPSSITTCDSGDYQYGAFAGCKNLSSVTFSEGITSIPQYLFSGCEGIYSIVIPDGVLSIGDYAFSSCENLSSVSFPRSLREIGKYAFQFCCNLKSVNLPYGLESIKASAFRGCISMSDISIPDTVMLLARYAFRGCTSLVSVTLSKSLKCIGYGAFRDCSALTCIEIPAKVTKVDESISGDYFCYGPFFGCKNLKSITFEEGTTAIAPELFGGCEGLEFVAIPSGVDTIGRGAFYNCKNLKHINLPDTVTTIEYNAFASCSNLSDVVLPNSLEILGETAFGNCTALTKISIPRSVSTVSFGSNLRYGPFTGCDHLTTVLFEKGRTSIPASLCYKCDGVAQVVIPDGVTHIGYAAFDTCRNLESVVLPETLIEIANHAFSSCTKLNQITIPISATVIYPNAFSYNILTIYGWNGSYAETYAKENNIPFVSLGCIANPNTPTGNEPLWVSQLESNFTVTDGALSADLRIENQTAAAQTGRVLVAFYDECGRLCGVSVETVAVDGEKTKDLNFSVPVSGGATKFGTFLLDTFGKPLSAAFKSTIPQH